VPATVTSAHAALSPGAGAGVGAAQFLFLTRVDAAGPVGTGGCGLALVALVAGAIDGVGVNGSAFLARTLGWMGTRLQTGRVGTYVVLFVVGVLAVLSALTR
jgi:hypothetical protein